MSRARTGAVAVAVFLVAVVALLPGCTHSPHPTSAAAAPAPRVRRPSPADPLRVLLVGDGVMFDAAPAIEAALHAAGPVDVTAEPVLGFGLTRPEFYDWRTKWPALVGRVRPEVSVLFVGPWDVRTLDVGSRQLAPGGPGWAAWYRQLADEAIATLTAGGGELVWVGMTWEGVPGANPKAAALSTVLRALPADNDHVHFVDGAVALAGPGGAYEAVQVGAAGAPERIMKPDGEHLCPAGATRLARAVVRAVARGRELAPASGWEQGTWRDDPRYHWSFGGGCPAA